MATSSIKRNFIIEGQDAVDFVNSLDDALIEREKRGPFKFTGRVFNEQETKLELERMFGK